MREICSDSRGHLKTQIEHKESGVHLLADVGSDIDLSREWCRPRRTRCRAPSALHINWANGRGGRQARRSSFGDRGDPLGVHCKRFSGAAGLFDAGIAPQPIGVPSAVRALDDRERIAEGADLTLFRGDRAGSDGNDEGKGNRSLGEHGGISY